MWTLALSNLLFAEKRGIGTEAPALGGVTLKFTLLTLSPKPRQARDTSS